MCVIVCKPFSLDAAILIIRYWLQKFYIGSEKYKSVWECVRYDGAD